MSTNKLLFTPGPLTTSPGVKEAMLRDLGSRDAEFLQVVREIRQALLALGGVGTTGYEAVLMQGSGTFAVESMLGTLIPPNGRLLVAVNGAYGRRMVQIATRLGIDCQAAEFPENDAVDVSAIGAALTAKGPFTHLACVHCETTTGLMNPVEELGALCAQSGVRFLVDAMSSFGGVALDVGSAGIEALVSSANKCIQGVPGFGFALVRRQALLDAGGQARSVSLDLCAQWRGLEADGQFRFTPPTHALLAFHQALAELDAEGGVTARSARYWSNQRTLLQAMRAYGFQTYLEDRLQSAIITSFLYPSDEAFQFERFYQLLSLRGFVIYPGKLSQAQAFRIGTIGHVWPEDVRALTEAIGEVLTEMGLRVPLGASR